MRLLLLLGLLCLPAGAGAAMDQGQHLGAHGTATVDEFQQVIERRCTICHTRERIDEAIRRRADFERIETRMLERGAVLSERDKSVLGTFWGDPLKSGE